MEIFLCEITAGIGRHHAGLGASLSILGANTPNPAGESSLTYTWSAITIPTGAATPTFNLNGTNAAKSIVATFSKAGSYTFNVTVADSAGDSVVSTVNMTVSQTITTITLTSNVVAEGNTVQATGHDQFGNSIAPLWSATGGTINAAGLFTAGAVGGSFTISGSVNGTLINSSLIVVPTVYIGSVGNDVYAIRLSPTDSTVEQIFANIPETAAPTYAIPISQLSSFSFATANDGSLTIDFANGNPLPSMGISYTGGRSLFIEGAPAGSMAFTINSTQLIYMAASTSPINYSNVQAVQFDLAGGSNSLTQQTQPGAALTYNAGPLANTLNVNGGSFTFAGDPQTTSGSLTVNDKSAVVFSPPAPNTGYNARNLYALNLYANSTATLAASTTVADRTVLETSQLNIASTATLNLANNAMIVHNGNLASITSEIAQGLNTGNGYWNGNGIGSSTAALDPSFLTAVGAISNNSSLVAAIYTSFDQQPVSQTDVLVKYTYVGDANLDGQIDGSDYSRLDSGELTHATGWFNGDFSYDGNEDGSDYTLIDNAFNTQVAQLASAIATTSTMLTAARIAPRSPTMQASTENQFSNAAIPPATDEALRLIKRSNKRMGGVSQLLSLGR